MTEGLSLAAVGLMFFWLHKQGVMLDLLNKRMTGQKEIMLLLNNQISLLNDALGQQIKLNIDLNDRLGLVEGRTAGLLMKSLIQASKNPLPAGDDQG